MQSVSLDKRERVIWLRFDIYSNYIKSCVAVSGSGTTGTAEQIQQPRLPSKCGKRISVDVLSGGGSNSFTWNHT